ncbi:MAG: cyclase family protein [Candidatus Binataceae bacterium]
MAKAKKRKIAAPDRAKPSRKTVPVKSGVKAKGKQARSAPKLSAKPGGKTANAPQIAVRAAKPKAKTRRVTSSGRAQPAPTPYRAPAPDLPSYDELPVRAGAPAGSAWGVFGDDDQLGTINLLTPERVREATGSIREGRVFALNLPIDIPDPPLFTRGKHNHTIKHFGNYILDDYLDNFYPQASSQWDALSHVKHPTLGAYNGIPENEITGYGGTKLGIDNLARRGMAGRGVLADLARYHQRYGRTIDFKRNESIPLEELRETLNAQKTQLRPGDILLIRIGWTQAYLDMSAEEKAELARDTKCPGIEGSARVARWLWENHIAAVASDAPGLEAIPPPNVSDFMQATDLLHFHMLSFFGMPIGEMWNLEELAEACAVDGRYDFFFTSAPLNIPGGVGSPPNALAIR